MTTSAQNLTSRNERVINTQTLGALPSIEYGLIRAHVFASLVTLVISVLFGSLVATKFTFPEFLGGHGWLTWGRLRYNHTQGIFFGWLGNAFLAFFYYAVPRLADRPVLSRKLGWFLFCIWNFAVVLPGWVLVAAGFSQPLEWAEFPLVVDAFVVLAFILMVLEFVLPFLKARLSDLYVSAWYIIGGIVFTMLAYPVGNFVPELVPGARGAAFSGLWIHDAVGLFVTPFALAIAYYVIPATTRRAIFSHFLSMVGFWLLFFIYPLNGTHHYVYSAIPMAAQKGAIVASAYLGMDVILVVSNLLLSLRGSSGTVSKDVPLRFVWFGVVSYLLVSLQGSVQALMPVNRFIHFTDWVIGHSHLAMIGFASCIALGGIAHLWQRIPGTRYNERMMNWSFWLLAVGLTLMVTDLTIAGLVEGQVWQSSAPWIDSVRAVGSYWLVRTLSGLPILAGFVLFWISLVTGPRLSEAITSGTSREASESVIAFENVSPVSDKVSSTGWLSHAHVIAFGAGVGFFALSFLVLALLPGKALEDDIKVPAPASMLTPADYDRRDSSIARDPPARAPPPSGPIAMTGGYSLTAPVLHPASDRDDLQEEVSRGRTLFAANCASCHGSAGRGDGKASASLLPKPANLTAARFSDERLSSVLWNGVAGSAMPPRRQMPTEDLRALVAYIHSLHVPGAAPSTQEATSLNEGKPLFAANCASCHGDTVAGNGPATGALAPSPTNFHLKKPTQERAWDVLENGVPGTAMPPWRSQLNADERRALVEFVRSLYGSPQENLGR